jgi:hypothetical protein
VLQGLPRPLADPGALEDFAFLPDGPRLAALCSENSPLATALRVRFGSRCARALVGELARAPLPAAGLQALRQLADTFVLREAGQALRGRGAVRELLSLWRADLPMPAALEELLRGSPADRAGFAAALGGRLDRRSVAALAGLLAAPEAEVRVAAGEALRASFGELVPYDPDAPPSALNAAADRVRSLHNRTP